MITAFFALGLLAASPLNLGNTNPQVPTVEQAFRPDALAVTADRILVRFDIADDTYLYRHNLSFRVQASDVRLDRYELPEGVMATDEFFGESEVYRGQMEVELPLLRFPGSEEIALEMRYQGCADVGICYPPQQQSINVELIPLSDD